jgi:N-acyl homoserine lactone hydrolase
MRTWTARISLIATLALAGCALKPLPVPNPPPPLTIPTSSPPAGMSISTVVTGSMTQSAALAYQGGAVLGDTRTFVIGGILVRHPQGTLLFDAGFGPKFETETPFLLRIFSKPRRADGAASQLRQAGTPPETLKAVILTHAHYDHVSGLADFPPEVEVWVAPGEKRFIERDDDLTDVARSFGLGRYKEIAFVGGPYLGFHRSLDVFGDGSVVLVEAPGHTPGSVVAFVNLPDGKRYALIGDTAWQTDGVDHPAEKSWLIRWMTDDDRDDTQQMLIRLHLIKAAMPDLIIVPAHDKRVWDRLPKL